MIKTVLGDTLLCAGCRACEQVCAVHAISMVPSDEGFLYPHIDPETCVGCGRCRKVCPAHNPPEHRQPLEIYAAVHRDERILTDSSSGGAFTALADLAFDKGGLAVGCVLDRDFRAKQVVVSDPQLLFECRGSKYVQSDTGNTFSAVKKVLDDGMFVFFSGTPCQVAGLKNFLGRDYENLLTADFICHGVPSPRLFEQHIHWLEEKNGHKISRYRFRSKVGAAGSNLYYYYYFLQSVKIVSGSAVLDPYYFAFLNAKTYRECCYRCPYAEEKRVSDFTFADYWSAERFHPELAGSNGVSILTFNTEKSLTYKGQIEESMNLIPSKLEWIKQINFNLNQPAERPACRDSIYRDIQKYGYARWADAYCATLDWKLRNLFEKLPARFRIWAKKLLKR